MKHSRGFILTEGIIASTIIATAVVGILALLASSLRMAQFSKNQLIAAMLAQEGIEVVRAKRDANWIAGVAWNTGLSSGDYQVQYDSISLSPYTGSPLRFDSTSRRYQYLVGTDTEFTRRIIITNLVTNRMEDEMRVISRVAWTTRGVPFAVDVETHLFNWLTP